MGWASSEQETFLYEYKKQFDEAFNSSNSTLSKTIVQEVFNKFSEKWGPEHWHFINGSKYAKGENETEEDVLRRKNADMEIVSDISLQICKTYIYILISVCITGIITDQSQGLQKLARR